MGNPMVSASAMILSQSVSSMEGCSGKSECASDGEASVSYDCNVLSTRSRTSAGSAASTGSLSAAVLMAFVEVRRPRPTRYCTVGSQGNGCLFRDCLTECLSRRRQDPRVTPSRLE